ncbi:unnamed protein product [Urochloa humidicola]
MMQVTVAFKHFFHVVNKNKRLHELGKCTPSAAACMQQTRPSSGTGSGPATTYGNAEEVTEREHTRRTASTYIKDWVWKSQDELFLYGGLLLPVRLPERASADRFDRRQGQEQPVHAESLTKFAGTLNCRVGRRC